LALGLAIHFHNIVEGGFVVIEVEEMKKPLLKAITFSELLLSSLSILNLARADIWDSDSGIIIQHLLSVNKLT
jgi:hypothetical protein